jgi:tRNA 2-thiouridine synthesizing protein C
MAKSTSNKRILIVCRQAPYGNALAREAIDVALATAVFDQNLALLFIGDGVWQLLKNQQSESIAAKSQQKMLAALVLYDIEDIYVDSEALNSRNITADELSITTKNLSSNRIVELLDNADIILNF